MGFMDELKKLARPYNEDEDDYDEYEDELDELDDEEEQDEEDLRTAPIRPERPAARPAPAAPAASAPAASAAPAPAMPSSINRPVAAPANVVNLHGSNLQVILVKPESYEAVSEIADHLRNKCAVVLNLESTNSDTARRLVDFLSGCAYALEGNIKKVATSTYILVPYNVDVVGNLMEELENSGVYY